MVSILDTIIKEKHREVARNKQLLPLKQLENLISLATFSTKSLQNNLQKKPGIIAEFKRASPSKGIIATHADPAEIANAYTKCNAAGISVLTDASFFKARPNDFKMVRNATNLPILRKEFIVDKYQIFESKYMGADVILLIAAILSKKEISEFVNLSIELGLEVLLELHNEEELMKLSGNESLIGINNRDLKSFKVDTQKSLRMVEKLRNNTFPLIAESGLNDVQTVLKLYDAGFSGFLMGEHFMRNINPEKELLRFTSIFNK